MVGFAAAVAVDQIRAQRTAHVAERIERERVGGENAVAFFEEIDAIECVSQLPAKRLPVDIVGQPGVRLGRVGRLNGFSQATIVHVLELTHQSFRMSTGGLLLLPNDGVVGHDWNIPMLIRRCFREVDIRRVLLDLFEVAVVVDVPCRRCHCRRWLFSFIARRTLRFSVVVLVAVRCQAKRAAVLRGFARLCWLVFSSFRGELFEIVGTLAQTALSSGTRLFVHRRHVLRFRCDRFKHGDFHLCHRLQLRHSLSCSSLAVTSSRDTHPIGPSAIVNFARPPVNSSAKKNKFQFLEKFFSPNFSREDFSRGKSFFFQPHKRECATRPLFIYFASMEDDTSSNVRHIFNPERTCNLVRAS